MRNTGKDVRKKNRKTQMKPANEKAAVDAAARKETPMQDNCITSPAKWESLSDTLPIFAGPDDVVEVRTIDGPAIQSAYFKDKALAVKEAMKMDGKANVYFVLNQMSESCYHRKNQNNLMKGMQSTSDKDITRRNWILIDCDPERPANISATDSEKDVAKVLRDAVGKFLLAKGFKAPIVADSGNGWHLLYRIDLPNDDTSKKLVEGFLKALSLLHSNGFAKIDTAVGNAGRITKLYGTMAVKGANTEERPWRKSRILRIPPTIEINDASLLQAVIDSATPDPMKQTRENEFTKFNLEDFIRKHGIQTKRAEPYDGGTKYVMQVCPFDPAHDNASAMIAELSTGALSFSCRHDGCSNNHWKEFRSLYEPGYDTRASRPTKQEEVWDTPIPFETTFSLPTFPVDCFPPWCRDYVSAVAEDTQTVPDMAAVITLAALSIPCNKVYRVEAKPGWQEPMALWTLAIARPAERKSAIMAHVTRIISAIEASKNDFLKIEIARNRTERKILEGTVTKLQQVAAGDGKTASKDAAMLKAEELANFKDINEIRYTCDDTSPEKLAGLIAENSGRMALVSAEGGIFGMMQGRYSANVNIDSFLKAHAGDPLRVDRIGRSSEYIESPALTMALTVQPDVLRGIMRNDTLKGRGLLARFLYCIPTSKVGARRIECNGIPESVRMKYEANMRIMFNTTPGDEPHILKLSPEAYQLSVQFAKELEPRLIDDLEHIADWAGKLHGAVIRIAGVLHVAAYVGWNPWEHPISSETITNAIAIGRYFIQHALAAFSLMGADEVVDGGKYVLKWIQRQGMQEHKKRDILRGTRGYFKEVSALDPILSRLCEYGYLREHEQERPGPGRKPDKMYTINPVLFFGNTLGQNGQNGQNSSFGGIKVISPFSPVGVPVQNEPTDDIPDWVREADNF